MGHHLFKVMHSTTVSVPHKELHPIKDTGVFKTPSWMEETWVTNHTVVLTTYHRTDVPILVNVSMKRLCGKLRKWDGSEWSWFRLSGLICATLWRLNAQRGTPASECPCVIGVLSTSIHFGDVEIGGQDLEASRFGRSSVRGSLCKMSLPLGFLVWMEIPAQGHGWSTGGAWGSRGGKKTVKIRWKHKPLDWAEVSWPSDNFSGRILHITPRPTSFRGSCWFYIRRVSLRVSKCLAATSCK